MQKYKVVFFDLDHTLWDYDRNSVETLKQLYTDHQLYDLGGFNITKFLTQFDKVNNYLWDQYNKGQISRDVIRKERFVRIFKNLHLEDHHRALQMSEEYVNLCPLKTHLIPHTHEVLQHLQKQYDLRLLTNGFNDIQEIKIDKSGLKPYFNGMVTSEQANAKKPAKEMFDYALHSADCEAHEAIMIGDNLKADISGAINAGIDAVFFNPSGINHSYKPHYEISSLKELTIIL